MPKFLFRFIEIFKTAGFIISLQKNSRETSEKRIVYAKLEDPRCGKYMFSLLAFLVLGGYKVYLFPNLRFIHSLLEYKKLINLLSNIHISLSPPQETSIYISSRATDSSSNFKSYTISYNYFDAENASIVLPYTMSPAHYDPQIINNLDRFRVNQKRVAVFFSGNQNLELYDNKIIKEKFKKVSRYSLLQYLKLNMPKEHMIIIQNEFTMQSALLDKFVLVDWRWSPEKFENEKARITDNMWLNQLSRCNFFLACPGMVMPMCHNIIEAMSVGTIPITQYAEEFYPPLKHGINSLTFDTAEGAKTLILEAINMTEDKIDGMRKNVIEYYEEHLSPLAFRKRLENDKARVNKIVLNAEQLSVS
jgi:hypothetical protein